MIRRALLVAECLSVLALAAYLVLCRWHDVGANLEAQVVIVAPGLTAHHLGMRHLQLHHHRDHAERQAARHAELLAAIAAQGPAAADRTDACG